MELHEFQAKQLLARYAVPCPPGLVAITADEAEAAARQLGPAAVVVKAQVRAGDRARAGGIKVATAPDMARASAAALLGQRLVTQQTGPAGQIVKRVLDPIEPPARGDAHVDIECQSEGRFPIMIDGLETGLLCPARMVPIASGHRKIAVFIPALREPVGQEVTVTTGYKPTLVRFPN